MAFPPLGIQTLAPVLRQRGHQVRMFDTCYPQMKAEYIAQAVAEEKPDAIALSFLSTTTYPSAKSMARRNRTAKWLRQADGGKLGRARLVLNDNRS